MAAITEFILGLGFFGLVTHLLILVGSPFLMWMWGTKELTVYRNPLRGYLYRGTAVTITIVTISSLLLFGRIIWFQLYRSLGPSLRGLVLIVLICIILLPVCYAGSLFRRYFRAHRLAVLSRVVVPRRLVRNSLLGAVAILILVILGFVTLPLKFALGVVVLVSLATLAGWWSGILVPDL